MSKVVTVFHSGYGHTKRVAEYVAQGVEKGGGGSTLLSVDELETPDAPGWAMLDAADAIIFGAPTYMGDCSARMRAFLEATSQRWMAGAWKDKLAAGFTNSGSQNGDKQNTLVSFATFAAQHGMIWVGLGIPPGNNHSGGSVQDINRLGASLGLKTQSNVDEAPDQAPLASDLETARLFGMRVAESAARWARQ
jgi:NAD(P)H dehydrogenase (quinone)